MSREYLMGIDIGTRSSKGAIVDLKGNIIAKKSLEHDLSKPKQGWFEHDAERIWWGDFKTICRALLSETGINPNKINAVGCSCLGPAMLPMDRENKPLRPAILYGIDTRASSEIQELNKTIGKRKILQISGNLLTTQSVGPKILWFKKHEPDLFKRTFKIVTASTYLVYKLTGEYVIDHYTAATFEPLFNLQDLKWGEEMCEIIGISPQLLPEIHLPTEIAGQVNDIASKETGLAKGTPVIVGGLDAMMEEVSAGATEEGEIVLIYGSTMVIFGILREPKIEPSLIFRPFLFPGKYVAVGAMSTSGILIKWFRDNFAQSELELERKMGKNAFDLLSNKTNKIPAGSEGLVVLPYFSGERTPIWDENARGVIFGLTLYHTKAHIFRAILEGIAYGLLQHLKIMEGIGLKVKKIKAIGGGTKDITWTQIISDVTGKKQECMSQSADAYLGAAYLAGYGIGIFKDFKPLREEWIKVERIVQPNQGNWSIYQKYYQIYDGLYERTKKQMHELSILTKEIKK